MNKQDSKMYNKFKKYWKLLLKNATRLSDKKYLQNRMFNYKYMSEEDIIETLLSSNRYFKASYNLYQDILITINNRNFERFKRIIENNYSKFDGNIKTSLKTFKKYFEYIENSLSFPYSNGRIEGVIRKIKVLKNTAYGYKSFLNFKKRILICANL